MSHILREADKEEFERALDTIAGLLRTYGVHSFDVGEIDAGAVREGCESWAQQILLGNARQRRDYGGARAFLNEQRRRESDQVQRSLRDLRQAVWLLVRGLSQALVDERAADEEARRQMERLLGMVDKGTAEELKRETSAAVSLWGRHLELRQQRQRQQVRELASRLQPVQGNLQESPAQVTLDALTRLPDQAAFLERLGQVRDLSLVLERTLSIALLDIDRLRGVNHGSGQAAGDALIKDLGRRLLRQFFRRDDMVARWGGGTFAVLLPEATLPGAVIATQRALGALRPGLGATVSIGVAELLPGEGCEALLGRARTALKRAKEAGGDRVEADE